MNKLLLFLVAAMLLGSTACQKAKKLGPTFTFYVSSNYPFMFPPSTLVGQLPPISVATNNNAADEFRANNTSAELVQDASLESVSLTINSPSGANFDFLESISFYISTDMQGSDRIKMATLMSVPRGVSTIQLQPTDAKLDKYLKASSYVMSVEPNFRTPQTQNLTMRIDYKFKIVANPLN